MSGIIPAQHTSTGDTSAERKKNPRVRIPSERIYADKIEGIIKSTRQEATGERKERKKGGKEERRRFRTAKRLAKLIADSSSDDWAIGLRGRAFSTSCSPRGKKNPRHVAASDAAFARARVQECDCAPPRGGSSKENSPVHLPAAGSPRSSTHFPVRGKRYVYLRVPPFTPPPSLPLAPFTVGSSVPRTAFEIRRRRRRTFEPSDRMKKKAPREGQTLISSWDPEVYRTNYRVCSYE